MAATEATAVKEELQLQLRRLQSQQATQMPHRRLPQAMVALVAMPGLGELPVGVVALLGYQAKAETVATVSQRLR
jgi:hypothetical protein